MTTPVDVLIIGAGASGAGGTGSLAETKMLLWPEPGDGMQPPGYPGPGRDREVRQLNDCNASPNRGARETDHPMACPVTTRSLPISLAGSAATRSPSGRGC